MLINIFKKSYFTQIIIYILPVLLWIPAIANPPQMINLGKMDMPLYLGLYEAIGSYPTLAVLLALILVYAQSLFFNFVLSFYQLSKKTTYFPAFIYVLLMSSDYRIMTLSSVLIANCFILPAIFFFLRCYNRHEGLDEIFITTIFLSVATMFYAPCILLMVWVWFGLFNFKIYRWRSFAVSIFGFLTPVAVLFVYYYLCNELDKIILFAQHFMLLPSFVFLSQPIQVVYLAFLVILALPAMFTTLSYRNDQKLSVRKRTSTLVIMFALSLLPLLYNLNSPTMTLIIVPALSYILVVYLMNMKKHTYADLFVFILVLLTITKIFINF